MASRPPPLLFLLLHTISLTLAAADSVNPSPTIFLSVCGKNETQNAESFDIDFVAAMENIYQNISTTGFATSSSGSAPTVYGLGQCFSYLSHVSCQLCYSRSRVKLPHCLPSTAGRIYLDGCFLEYADREVSTHSVDEDDTYSCSNTTIADALRPRFNVLVADWFDNLTVSAYRAAEYYQVAMNAGCFLRYSTEPFYVTHADGDSDGSDGNALLPRYVLKNKNLFFFPARFHLLLLNRFETSVCLRS